MRRRVRAYVVSGVVLLVLGALVVTFGTDIVVALSGGRTDAALVNAASLVITLVRLSAIPLGATLIGAGLVIRELAPSDS
nr:hypothetical protein [Actinomycetales bacterium]